MREIIGEDWPRTGKNGVEGRRLMPSMGGKEHDDDETLYIVIMLTHNQQSPNSELQ